MAGTASIWHGDKDTRTEPWKIPILTTWVEEGPVKEMGMKGDRTSSGKSSCNFII